ncbi:hypothetical protein ACGFNU_24420 [Spirillospora sp. NPDC048911]|uniref:hypothetical protein n=1 Tax=Spirillospora sp. NPDC048911 TaxID=3364527 RepID=UPI00371EFB07
MTDQPTPPDTHAEVDTEPQDEPQALDPMVAALLREREGYVQRGMDDRVAQVDEQLRIRGHQPPAVPAKTGKGSRSSSAQPKGRQAPGKATT